MIVILSHFSNCIEFLENFQEPPGRLAKPPGDTYLLHAILGSFEEPPGGMNGPPGDTSCANQFSRFWMNGLVMMNNR